MAHHHMYLVAGFFGFSNLGGITYFHHVREALQTAFERAGHTLEVHSVPTLPTGSIRRRTALLAEAIARSAGDCGPIHLVGHSTGGLDTRLLVTPGVSLPVDDDVDVEALARRVRSVTTVASPHLGTPMASFFNNFFGENILRAISLGTIYTLRFGRLPLRALIELAGIVTRLDRLVGLDNTILDQFYHELFKDFDAERRDEISAFLDDIRVDRSVVGQLTPGAIDLFNASTGDRPTVRYGSVVTRAPGFSPKTALRLGADAYAHASHVLFRALQVITARSGDYPPLKPDQYQVLVEAYGALPGRRESDGVVPTLAQVWGEVIHATVADHLDVCGHFNDAHHTPPHVDWFISGSAFTRERFDRLWDDVAAFQLASLR
ncbi:triacylglycerol lipase [Bradymonadaceae bacterium TMQ3]|nr:triacylglycerol lipase [Bradymonadaceae bacterium TMQ3]TXC77348.1 triacylglycerol lipase [Bradymonadales bacterium TMQ1]